MIRIVKGCTVAAAIVGASAASAGGLWLNEFGDFASGRAAAGAVAGVDDPMTMAYNPASITRLDGNQLFVAAGAIVGDMNFDIDYTTPRNGTHDGGNAGETAPFASMAYVHDFNSDKWSAGIGLATLSGAGMDYGDIWAGRYQATKVALLATALTPTLGYRVNDQLSLGVSAQIYYADLDVDV
ncbi:MAG TPA: outer membrane protein transport protein, partial [Halioglobus sp.]